MAVDNSGQLANNLIEYLNRVNTAGSGTDTTQLSGIINEFLAEGEKLTTENDAAIETFGIYKKFSAQDMVTGKVEIVTQGIWTGDTGSLTTFFTSSTQDTGASGKYYLDIYQTGSALSTAVVQFSLTYGHRTGGGWRSLSEDDTSTLPTKGTYSQYRNMLLQPNDTQFTFTTSSADSGFDSDDIYVININRARYREKMDPGNIQITLSGSKGLHTFIDDSGKKLDDTVGKAGRIFNIVSGTLDLGQPSSSIFLEQDGVSGQGFGLFYPDAGLIVLNPTAMSASLGLEFMPTTTTVSDSYNHRLMYDAFVRGGDFQARRTENISTAHYFVRLRNREYNFSNNPTFFTGSDGSLVQKTFEGDPKTFPTTIGLYNDANELLAVAKMSQPIPKSFDKELLVKVKLDF